MNDLKTVVRYFEMRWEGKTDFEALAMCDRREMERTAMAALRGVLMVEVAGFEPVTFWSRINRNAKVVRELNNGFYGDTGFHALPTYTLSV